MNETQTSAGGGWLEANLKDAEFQRLYAREDLIEDFLGAVEEEMTRQGVTRSELAVRLGCKPANITQIMRRTRNLTASTMVDIAFHLGLRLKLQVERTDAEARLADREGREVWTPSSKVVPLVKHWRGGGHVRFKDRSPLVPVGDRQALAS